MKYIVDTSVWSLALRRQHELENKQVDKLKILLREGEGILLPGIILQEILQGIRKQAQFLQVRESLKYFPFLEATRDDYLYAAELYNTCRSKGMQATTIDLLIASLSIRHDCMLLTADKGFIHIAKHCELRLL